MSKGKTAKLSVRITQDHRDRLEAAAKAAGTSLSRVLEQMIEKRNNWKGKHEHEQD